jgi:hypothetical protein
MDFDSLVNGPIFDVFGRTAELLDRNGNSYTATVLDRTKGVEITEGQVGVTSIRPIAAMRASDLVALGLPHSELDGGALRFGEGRWHIDYIMERPSPFGAADGQVWLILSRDDC